MAKWGNEDLVKDEILQHLPVKSLIRFKSVSKQWRSMIESIPISLGNIWFVLSQTRKLLLDQGLMMTTTR